MKTQIEQFQSLYNFYKGMSINADNSAQMMQGLFPNDNTIVDLWKEKAAIWRDAAAQLDTTCALCNIFLKTEPIETKQDRSILLVTSEKY